MLTSLWHYQRERRIAEQVCQPLVGRWVVVHTSAGGMICEGRLQTWWPAVVLQPHIISFSAAGRLPARLVEMPGPMAFAWGTVFMLREMDHDLAAQYRDAYNAAQQTPSGNYQ